jgi:hypothetical protein
MFYFFVHGNGAVELRPVDDEPVADEPATGSRLPPRVGAQDEAQGTRKIFSSRRRNRPIGGYMPFEKSRSYIGTFAFLAVLGLGSLVAYAYFNKLDTISKATGRTANNVFQSQDEAKRKEFQARHKKAIENLEKLKKHPTTGQAVGAKVEDGRLSGDETHD